MPIFTFIYLRCLIVSDLLLSRMLSNVRGTNPTFPDLTASEYKLSSINITEDFNVEEFIGNAVFNTIHSRGSTRSFINSIQALHQFKDTSLSWLPCCNGIENPTHAVLVQQAK